MYIGYDVIIFELSNVILLSVEEYVLLIGLPHKFKDVKAVLLLKSILLMLLPLKAKTVNAVL